MDPIDDLLADLLEAPDAEWRLRLDQVCAANPAAAGELRRRFAQLERHGVASPLVDFPLDEAPTSFGPYRLLRRLGSGGMGVVWLARHEELGREVAIKMIRPERLWFDRAHERFEREVEAVARLRHPGCVQVHQVGTAEGVPYFAMEYVAGVDCEQLLVALRGKRLDPAVMTGADVLDALRSCGVQLEAGGAAAFAGSWVQVAVRIALAAAEALAHAHARGVVHRDLKPGNLMLAPDGRVVVVDFGLAAAAGSGRLTREGSLLGSVPYMAPEQLRSDPAAIGERTDVYALAVCLHELLALAPPFAGDEAALRAAILAGDGAPLRKRNPAVGSDLATVVAQAMHPDPARRYPSMLEFAADLIAVRDDQPIRARRDGPLVSVLRWLRHRPAVATGVALAALAIPSVPVLMSIASAHERDRAQHAEQMALRREYTANVAAANAALLAGNGVEARLRLEACASALRAFEWEHVAMALDGSLHQRATGLPEVAAIAVSADGSRVAVAGGGRIGICDASLAAPVRWLAAGLPSNPIALAFDAHDRELFVVDAAQAVSVHDVASGVLLRQRARSVGYERILLPDGVRELVCDRGAGRFARLDPVTFAELGSFEASLAAWPDTDVVQWVDGSLAAAGQAGVALFDGRSGRLVADWPLARPTSLCGAASSPLTLAATDGAEVLLWEPGANRTLRLDAAGRRPQQVLFSRQARHIVVLCATGEMLVRDSGTGRLLRTLHGHRAAVTAAAVVPGTDSFVTGDADGVLRLWSCHLTNDKLELHGIGEGNGLAVLPDGRLLTGGADAVVRCVDASTGRVSWSAPHEHWVHAVVHDPASDLVVSSVGARLLCWSARDGTARGELALPRDSGGVSRLAAPPDGGPLLVGTRSGRVWLFDAGARRLLATAGALPGPVTEVAFDAARQRWLCGGQGGLVACSASLERSTPLWRSDGRVLTFALDGDRIYASEQADGNTSSLLELDAANGGLLRRLPLGDPVLVLRALPPERLVAGTSRGHIAFWDTRTLTPVLDLPQFAQGVRNLAVGRYGAFVAAIGVGGPPRVLHRRAPAPHGASVVADRILIATARALAAAALEPTHWPPHARQTLQAMPGIGDEERRAAIDLLPPPNRWALMTVSRELAINPAGARRHEARLRVMSEALEDALGWDGDAHALATRCSHALVAMRLGEPAKALAALEQVTIDAQLGPDDGAGWFRPLMHFVRAMAALRLGDLGLAATERQALALLAEGAFVGEPSARLLLREIDVALRERKRW